VWTHCPVWESQVSIVQALLSSQLIGVLMQVPVRGSHELIVQALLSLQSFGAERQVPVGVQVTRSQALRGAGQSPEPLQAQTDLPVASRTPHNPEPQSPFLRQICPIPRLLAAPAILTPETASTPPAIAPIPRLSTSRREEAAMTRVNRSN